METILTLRQNTSTNHVETSYQDGLCILEHLLLLLPDQLNGTEIELRSDAAVPWPWVICKLMDSRCCFLFMMSAQEFEFDSREWRAFFLVNGDAAQHIPPSTCTTLQARLPKGYEHITFLETSAFHESAMISKYTAAKCFGKFRSNPALSSFREFLQDNDLVLWNESG